MIANESVDEADLKEWLSKVLPYYMIPDYYIFLEHMPITLGGKIDYSLLPPPKKISSNYLKPSTKEEKILQDVIESLLGIYEPNMNDNFIYLGGDSIKAIQVASELKRRGYSLKVKEVLSSRSLKEMAELIKDDVHLSLALQNKCVGKIENTPIIDWFFNLELENIDHFHQYVAFKINKAYNDSDVIDAIKYLVDRHDMLRVNYDKEKKELYFNERVNEMFFFYNEDIELTSDIEKGFCVNCLIQRMCSSIDISRDTLMKFAMIKINENSRTFVLTAHHLIIDGISWRILIDDFLYRLDNSECTNYPLKTYSYQQWADFLTNRSREELSQSSNYWNNLIKNSEGISLKYTNKDTSSIQKSVIVRHLNQDILEKLSDKPFHVYKINIEEILIIAFSIAYEQCFGETEIIIELEKHGRETFKENIDVSRTIGWFTCMYPQYIYIDSNDINNNIKSIKDQLRETAKYGFDYSIIFQGSYNVFKPIPHVRFNYLGDFDYLINKYEIDSKSLCFGFSSDERNLPSADLELNIFNFNGSLKIEIEYNTEIIDRTRIVDLSELLIQELLNIISVSNEHKNVELTSSDFNDVVISNDDLNEIFD